MGSGCPSTADLGPIHSWDPYIEGNLARNLGELAMENTVEVPTVIGMSAAQAEVILVAAGLTHAETAPKTTQPPGMVTSQSPAVGPWVPPKTMIHLTFASLTAP